MNCKNCGIKIMPSLARQQEGGESLCRGCYLDLLAKRVEEKGEKR
jgi:formylmethanofuran dehydrogenase subunit E